MNENAIREILNGVIKNVMGEMHCDTAAPASPSCATETGPIPVEISARHVHLSEADAIELFGHPLTAVRELSQPGQFLAEERVRLIGPKGVMNNVAVLGPSRSTSQVEVSKTDARSLGIKDAPVRQSGDLKGSAGVILASQNGIIGLEEGLIVASRHIHMGPADAARLGLHDKDVVCVKINGDRPVILEDVLVRVGDNFKLAMHIDADEGNSCGWSPKVTGTIVRK
ncbi:phosphate propanoyltransferase [Desulfobaculum bizertense]|uniref:Phosphate propanoyltransferase n=1 Tax=Desulfobaculum bizertense DSM 18034 TaxID=1121442 RepID=A0A1T4W4D7_9BACT|nr:phosphate propanoyltransferase [Desulfobaculum bizertense]UIJ38667.1 phosphate propanoyltransferase [Desulfobaculum bizertense]SKA72184.1 Propanediol utilization protein [Desulfobaculum bizertense DSM 18034]